MSNSFPIYQLISVQYNINLAETIKYQRYWNSDVRALIECAERLGIQFEYDLTTTQHIGDAEGVPYYSHDISLVVEDDDEALLFKLAKGEHKQ